MSADRVYRIAVCIITKGKGQPAVFPSLLAPFLFPYARLALKKDSRCKAVSIKHRSTLPSLGGRWFSHFRRKPDEGPALPTLWAVCSHKPARIFFERQWSASGAKQGKRGSLRGGVKPAPAGCTPPLLAVAPALMRAPPAHKRFSIIYKIMQISPPLPSLMMRPSVSDSFARASSGICPSFV